MTENRKISTMQFHDTNVQDTLNLEVYTDEGTRLGKVADLELDLKNSSVEYIVVDISSGGEYARRMVNGDGLKIPSKAIKGIDDSVTTAHFLERIGGDEV